MIDGLNSITASTYLEQAKSASAKALNNSLSKDYSSATDEELMGACRQFESYFIEQVFKALEKTATVFEEDKESSGSAVNMFKDQMYQEYASMAMENEDFGIAKALYEQMKRNYSVD